MKSYKFTLNTSITIEQITVRILSISCQFYQWNVINCLRMRVVFKVLFTLVLYTLHFCTFSNQNMIR